MIHGMMRLNSHKMSTYCLIPRSILLFSLWCFFFSLRLLLPDKIPFLFLICTRKHTSKSLTLKYGSLALQNRCFQLKADSAYTNGQMIKFDTLPVQICALVFRLLILRLLIQYFHILSHQNRNKKTLSVDETETQTYLQYSKCKSHSKPGNCGSTGAALQNKAARTEDQLDTKYMLQRYTQLGHEDSMPISSQNASQALVPLDGNSLSTLLKSYP